MAQIMPKYHLAFGVAKSPEGDSAPPLGDCKLALNKVLLPTFPHRKVAPRRVGMLTKPCKRPRPAARRLQTGSVGKER